MEQEKQKYKEAIKYFLNSKIFIITIILVTILSYGFTITNSSIGVDDTAFDRYYQGKEMLSIGRWGAYIVYQILNITEFTPFWADLVASIVIVTTAIAWCVFLKKNLKDKIPMGAYIVFASMFISYPLINEIFIYQNCNIAVMLGSLLASIGIMIFYENYQVLHKKYLYLLTIITLTVGMSMYEASAQIMILAICITAILMIFEQENKKQWKNILKYFSLALAILVISVILNSVIVKITYLLGVHVSEVAEKEINWGNYSIIESLQMICYEIKSSVINITYFPVLIFGISIILGFFISIIQYYKKRNIMIIILYLGMILSNFAIAILQLKGVIYRACTSWGLFVAIIALICYKYVSKYKVTKIMTTIFIFILVLQQTKYLNQMFYNDYIRYQRDLNIAFNLINELEQSYNTNKPLVIMGTPKKSIGKDGSQVNSLSVLWWGKKAFNDNGAEFIKFLNSLGYNFKRPSDEQYEKGKVEAETMSSYPQKGSIVELQDCIVVNF